MYVSTSIHPRHSTFPNCIVVYYGCMLSWFVAPVDMNSCSKPPSHCPLNILTLMVAHFFERGNCLITRAIIVQIISKCIAYEYGFVPSWPIAPMHVNYTKYDFWCHMVVYVTMITFWKTFLMKKWANIVIDDGWVHPLVKTLPSLVNNLWWDIVTDDWNLDEKSRGKWQYKILATL